MVGEAGSGNLAIEMAEGHVARRQPQPLDLQPTPFPLRQILRGVRR
jgi:hypothetical protein